MTNHVPSLFTWAPDIHEYVAKYYGESVAHHKNPAEAAAPLWLELQGGE
jgi:hypothetical protein